MLWRQHPACEKWGQQSQEFQAPLEHRPGSRCLQCVKQHLFSWILVFSSFLNLWLLETSQWDNSGISALTGQAWWSDIDPWTLRKWEERTDGAEQSSVAHLCSTVCARPLHTDAAHNNTFTPAPLYVPVHYIRTHSDTFLKGFKEVHSQILPVWICLQPFADPYPHLCWKDPAQDFYVCPQVQSLNLFILCFPIALYHSC